jgi:hypothetical protein
MHCNSLKTIAPTKKRRCTDRSTFLARIIHELCPRSEPLRWRRKLVLGLESWVSGLNSTRDSKRETRNSFLCPLASFRFLVSKRRASFLQLARIIHGRGELATQCSVRGSKPRRERTREYTGAPTCSSLPQFAFRSMASVTKVFAARPKVQLYWTRSERLASSDEIS